MKMIQSRSTWLCALAAAALCSMTATVSFAQPYPNKTIRIIVAGSPGGGTDLVARVTGQKLADALGQQVVAENRIAAGGNTAYEFTANARPDGYTLLVVPPSLTTNPSLYQKVAYNPRKDFAPITQLAAMSYVLIVPASMPVKSLKEFIAYAKAKKPPLTYGSGGAGQLAHLGTELLMTLEGFSAVHVPFKGDSPAMLAVLGGEIDAFISAMPVALPHIATGKIKALAVTGSKRSPLMPEISTVAESGVPGYEVSGWFGFLAPGGTPKEIVSRLYGETSKILKQSDIRQRLEDNGIEPVGSTPEEFSALINSEMIKWAKIIKQSGARAN